MIVAAMMVLVMAGATTDYQLQVEIADANGIVARPILIVQDGQRVTVKQSGEHDYRLDATVTPGMQDDVAQVAVTVTPTDAPAQAQNFNTVLRVGTSAEIRYDAPSRVRRVMVKVDMVRPATGMR